MNQEDQDELWDLLGKARTPKERPFFSAKVLRAIEADGARASQSVSLWEVFRRRWLLPLAGCSAAVLAVMFAVKPPAPTTVQDPGVVNVTPADPLAPLINNTDLAAELPAALDNFLATQDNALWLQADPSSLYP
jgi:hypothetical protein